MRGLYHFKQVGFVGPTGVGKTHLVYRIASECQLPLFEVNCALQTSSYELVGKFIGLGRENWVDGTIIMWCRYGGILYLEEANMMRSDVLSKCHPIMDQRGHIILTEKENEIIRRHPQGYIILSFNPYSIEYAGTKPLNVAFRRRVSAWFHFDYLSKGAKINDFEVQAVVKNGLDDQETAYKMVRVAAELRRLYENGEIPLAPSLGNLACWAKLVSTDEVSVVEAADETIVDTISDDPSFTDNPTWRSSREFSSNSGTKINSRLPWRQNTARARCSTAVFLAISRASARGGADSSQTVRSSA